MSEPDYDGVGSPVAANEEEGRAGPDVDDSVDDDRVVDDVSAGESESESVEEAEGESVSEEREKDDSLPSEVTRESEKSDSDGESGEGEEEKSGVELELLDPDMERSVETSVSSHSRGVRSSGFLESDESEGEGETEGRGGGDPVEGGEGEDGAGGGGEDVSIVRGGGRKFLGDSDDEEEAAGPGDQSPGTTEGDSRGEKRGRVSSDSAGESEEESGAKRLREASGSEDEEEPERREELQHEVEDLGGDEGRGEVPDVGGERTVQEEEEEEEPGSEEEAGPSTAGMSDWDIMMQRRKEAMAKARKRRRRDIDIRAVDDHIMAMIREMRQAVDEDRQLNLARQPALKKLKMLPTVVAHLKKADLQTTFMECGILTVLAEWLNPLPDHSLPHLKIREAILDILKSYPIPESHILKSSRIGKAVMMLFRHPKETRKNKEKAGKLINEWARPIFGLASDFKSLGRDEREERDYANLSQAAKRRLSSSSDPKAASQEEEYEPSKPGDKGWIGRARVPMPSTRDYVVRPKWKVDTEFKRGPSKKVLNRYEKQINKEKQRKMQTKTSHAVSISVEGRKMPL